MTKPRITVLGTGYLGATHAACMAELGYEVLGFDVDEAKIAALREGRVPFFEPGLEPLLKKHVDSGALRFTTEYAEVADFGDVHFLAVGTPQRADGLGADLSQVEAAVAGLAKGLTRPAVVVGKSTVPVGTAAVLSVTLRTLAPAGEDVALVWNPEFLREGFAVQDTLRPDRLVLGFDVSPTELEPGATAAGGSGTTGAAARAEAALRDVYAETIAAGTPVIVSDYATAELVKVSANAFLATKISFINAVSEICELVGADVTRLADAIGYDDRIGRKFLNAGLGFGGGCLPKDIRAFMARAGELGAADSLAFLRDVDAVNMRRRTHTVDLARELVGGSFLNTRIAVLGAAFKPDSDDVRDSPALNVAGQLQLHGAHVSVYDPQANEVAKRYFPTLHYANSVDEAAVGADVVMHLTEWKEFRAIDPAQLKTIVARPVVIDGRNVLDAKTWRAAGWTYRGLGRP
jgi:UDPglucose 6-dehydrogenase